MNETQPSSSASGSFYCYIPRSPHLGQWLLSLSRTKSERLVNDKLDSVLSSWQDADAGRSNDATTPTSLSRTASLPQTQSYVYKGAGLSVKLGLEEVACDLFRVKPYVYSSPDSSAAIVFSGHLTNLSELLSRRSSKPAGGSRAAASPSLSSDYNNGDGGDDVGGSGLERKSSIERSLDIGATTAALVLSMYQEQGSEVIILSELQGEFALVIWDNSRKVAFAARDPSGDEPLFYHVSEDGAVAFAGSRLAVPDGEQPHEWRELPPGHFIVSASGKAPKLHQFALTPHQLALRELQQDDELGGSLRDWGYGGSGYGYGGGCGGGSGLSYGGGGTRVSPRHSSGTVGSGGGGFLGASEEAALAAQLSHRASLDGDARLDTDVFSLDL